MQLQVWDQLDTEDKYMSSVNKGTQRAFVLWLSGVRFGDISALAEVEMLVKQGVRVELEPSPITGPQAQHYQVFSGRLPASFGFFDTLMPDCHLPHPQQRASDYTVVENYSGRDASPKMLPDLLRAAGWTVEYEEVLPSELVACVQTLTYSEAPQAACKIVKCRVDELVQVDAQFVAPTTAEGESIAEALRMARSWVGEAGLLALLSDTQSAPVERFVNINNFLAEMGVIERDEQSGFINWPNSLAYYVGHGQLWINLLGRDPQGAVHPRVEYEEVRDTLVKALPTRLRDTQTGAPVIERVYRKEELYPDEYLFCAPDLVVLFKPGYVPSLHSTRLDFDEAIFTTSAVGTVAMAGAHPSLLKGFFLVSAPSMVSGISLFESAPLTAVVPSLLHALGVEYVDMDSPAVSRLFSPSYLETHPIRAGGRSQVLSEEDEELVINRLRDLGYV